MKYFMKPLKEEIILSVIIANSYFSGKYNTKMYLIYCTM